MTVLLLFIFLVGGARLPMAEPALQASDVFKPTRSLLSISFKERFTDLSNGTEVLPAEYWISRGVLGLSFRVTYHIGAPVSQLFLLYPDADPFIMRWILVPEKSLCYKNTFSKKDYPFNPHHIPFQVYWHRLTDNLYQMAGDNKIDVLGEEEVAGYRCRKIAIGPLPEKGWMVWYSPELDLLLRVEAYEHGKQTFRKEVSDVKEGRFASEVFKLPSGCSIQALSIKEFDALDIRPHPQQDKPGPAQNQ